MAPMAGTVMVRIPTELVERAKKLLPELANHPAFVIGVRRSTSAVLRIAIMRGLDELEREAEEGRKNVAEAD